LTWVLTVAALGDGRRDQGVAGGDDVDGGDQLLRRDVLEQEAAGAGAERIVDVLVEVERGEHEHRDPLLALGHLGRGHDGRSAASNRRVVADRAAANVNTGRSPPPEAPWSPAGRFAEYGATLLAYSLSVLGRLQLTQKHLPGIEARPPGQGDDTNKSEYEDRATAAHYARQSDLQPPEEAVLSLIVDELPEKRMLDIGVGGGRTALHFAKWTKAYVGVDYSAAMIAECRKRFANYPSRMSFAEADATRLTSFADDSFDFVLFSFNGIDYVPHADRLEVLNEVHRICRPGGQFCFSTHNLQAAPQLFSPRSQLSARPGRLVRRLGKWFLLRFVYNRPWAVKGLLRSGHAVFNDGAERGRFRTYYITPLVQIEQLDRGFSDIRVFASTDGRELIGEAQLRAAQDPWLYYLCSVVKQP